MAANAKLSKNILQMKVTLLLWCSFVCPQKIVIFLEWVHEREREHYRSISFGGFMFITRITIAG